MTPRRERQLGLSATTFLTLCVAFGADRTVFVLTIIAIGWAWFALCRRFPLVASFTRSFARGLFGR